MKKVTRIEIAQAFVASYGGKVWAKGRKVRIYRGEPTRQACLDIPPTAKSLMDASITSPRTGSWYSWESELWRDVMEFHNQTDYCLVNDNY